MTSRTISLPAAPVKEYTGSIRVFVQAAIAELTSRLSCHSTFKVEKHCLTDALFLEVVQAPGDVVNVIDFIRHARVLDRWRGRCTGKRHVLNHWSWSVIGDTKSRCHVIDHWRGAASGTPGTSVTHSVTGEGAV